MPIHAQFDLEFRKDGSIHDENQVSALLDGLTGLDNLLVISHGWNNDRSEAASLYDSFLTSAKDVEEAAIVEGVGSRRIGFVRIFWPSKKFADGDLIPGGGAASIDEATAASSQSLMKFLEELKHDPVILGGTHKEHVLSVHLNRAQELVPHLDREDARREYVQCLRAILNPDQNHTEDGSAEFFSKDTEQLFGDLSGPVNFTPAASSGGATSMNDGGSAGFIGDLADGVLGAARRIANFATYYQMKTRAGLVGQTGVALMLAQVRGQRPDLPINLVGHSFGGRLVAAAAARLRPGSKAVTMMLLQAAFSHNGFGQEFDGINDGAFRTVIQDQRITGPTVITHTKNDKAVGIAYPLASRIARDAAAAFGDENDPYGGIGRNGAQRTPEAKPGILNELGNRYKFQPGSIYNLKADAFIRDHGDVTGSQVAYAFWHGLVAGS